MRRALLLLLLLAGCRTAQVAAQGEHSVRARIIALPMGSQAGGGNGGVACVGLILRLHGSDLDLEAQTRFPPEALGAVTARELRDYLRGRGFSAEVLGGEVSSALPRGLLAYLERGHPATLLLDGRFVVAYGFDPVGQWVVVEDPLSGPRQLSFEELDALWRTSGRLMLVAAPVPRGA